MRLNIGCGDHPLSGYINVDSHSAAASIVGDARRLNFAEAAEVRCDHMLEHLPRADVAPLLSRFRSWLTAGGKLTVEVPDMAAIMAAGASDPWWEQYIYGAQNHEGEFHRSGFVAHTLGGALVAAGFNQVQVHEFRSGLPWRDGMPCLRGEGVA